MVRRLVPPRQRALHTAVVVVLSVLVLTAFINLLQFVHGGQGEELVS